MRLMRCRILELSGGMAALLALISPSHKYRDTVAYFSFRFIVATGTVANILNALDSHSSKKVQSLDKQKLSAMKLYFVFENSHIIMNQKILS